ncbi:MAG: hypothetical protein [Podoviridae sp. ctLUJ1]|nr:MAG: hypothetical protein [Podoviridae sp. ctLUJ1]
MPRNLKLNNGQTAKFLYEDDFSRPVYELENGRRAVCVNCDGTYLHSITPQYGEPDTPLVHDYQPVSQD